MADDRDAYDFYPCLVDGAPASIYLNMRYEDEPHPEADTIYWITARMRDAGDHGAGTQEEADVLNAFEERAIETLVAKGLFYAGRLRTGGIWEITFYGPAAQLEAVRAVAGTFAERQVETRSERDAEWGYYHDFLLPDAERRIWMDDRRLVDILEDQGDRLVTPRRVDHWASFPTAQARGEFVAAIAPLGFETGPEERDDDNRFWVQAHRVDPVELDHIHDVVMLLVDAAEQCGGDYDGWETSIEK